MKSLHWLKVSERIEYNIISLAKFSIPLSCRISMTSHLFSLLMVTLFTLRHYDQTIFIIQSHSSLPPTCFTSSSLHTHWSLNTTR